MHKRSFRYWTTRYIINRLQLMLYECTHPDSPWICQDAIQILDNWLKPTDIGLEWGTGRSTIWLASKVTHIISVEHDPNWAETVMKKLHDHGLTNCVDYNFLPDGTEQTGNCSYVNVVQNIEPNSLDFCLVDGVCRDHCAIACIEKLKYGAILIIDNINKYLPRKQKSHSPDSRGIDDGYASEKWEEFAKITTNWRYIWTTNGIWDTAFWIKE